MTKPVNYSEDINVNETVFTIKVDARFPELCKDIRDFIHRLNRQHREDEAEANRELNEYLEGMTPDEIDRELEQMQENIYDQFHPNEDEGEGEREYDSRDASNWMRGDDYQ